MKIYTYETIKNKLETQKKIKRIANYILYPIAIFIVICAINVVYQMAVKKEENVNLFGFRSFVVLSGSMEPNIQIGDMVISKKVDEENIKVGDIITFEEQGIIITHRVINIITKDGKKLYETKGDNNNTKDLGLVSLNDIKGEYVCKISKAGKITTKIITPVGIFLILLIVTLGYINSNKINKRKQERHLTREKYTQQEIL